MTLSPEQRSTLENWMRSKAILQCPACEDSRWRFAEAAYVRALLEAGDANLTEDKGVLKLLCGNCGYVALFDAETVGIRGLWDRGRDLQGFLGRDARGSRGSSPGHGGKDMDEEQRRKTRIGVKMLEGGGQGAV